MTWDQIEAVLAGVRRWPVEDQAELAELARDIEARRTGVYVLSDDERAAIAAAQDGDIVPDAQVDAFWKRHGMA